MGFVKNKKIIFISSIFVILIIVGFLTISINKNSPAETTDSVLGEEASQNNAKSIIIDFNGDGVGEILNVSEKQGEVVAKEVNMEVFNSEGVKIAELWDGINLYPTTLYKVVKLNENSAKQYLQWDMPVGPHEVETVFLTIVKDLVHPIYSINFQNNTMYTPFYTSRGSIVVGDANYDGLVELIENVDEYPVDAPRLDDQEIEQMIKSEFSDQGLDNASVKGFTEIVRRENYGKGRGRKAILAIHSFVDAETPFFRRLPEAEFEEIAGKLVVASEEIEKLPKDPNNSWEQESFVRYSDLLQDSKDFNTFVRDFWTHGRPFESPIPEDQTN